MGASSFSPSPITTMPSIDTSPSTVRMALVAAPSAPFLSPRPIQRAAAMAAASVTHESEWPGVSPYTRGPYASMYRSKVWTMRQFAGFGTAEDTNRRFHEILDAGGDGLSVAFDLPTL